MDLAEKARLKLIFIAAREARSKLLRASFRQGVNIETFSELFWTRIGMPVKIAHLRFVRRSKRKTILLLKTKCCSKDRALVAHFSSAIYQHASKFNSQTPKSPLNGRSNSHTTNRSTPIYQSGLLFRGCLLSKQSLLFFCIQHPIHHR